MKYFNTYFLVFKVNRRFLFWRYQTTESSFVYTKRLTEKNLKKFIDTYPESIYIISFKKIK